LNGWHPTDEKYLALLADGFKDWRLSVEGLVARPVSFSLEELQRLPAESHILLHACEQGWSYIAEWTGVRLARCWILPERVPEARYVVFEPFPNPNQSRTLVRALWETHDMADALHPQTLLAYGMNGEALPADFGAPLRLRLGRQMGWKNTKISLSNRRPQTAGTITEKAVAPGMEAYETHHIYLWLRPIGLAFAAAHAWVLSAGRCAFVGASFVRRGVRR